MNLNQITVPSLDLEKSVVFYKTLGLRLIVDALPRYARFECPDGDATLSVHLVKKLPTAEGISVYFETETLDEDVLYFCKSGLTFDLLPTDQPWLWREARLQDPDGNQIILYFAGDNRKNPPWRIDD